MESKDKVVFALAGAAALGAVGFLAYKWSRNQDKKPGKAQKGSKASEGSSGKEIAEDDTPDPDYEQAVKLKDEGNTAFKNGKYKEAIKLYTEAMKLSAKEVHFLLSNRSAAYLASGDLEHAQKDAEACIGVKPDWPKGYFRLGKVWAAKKDTKLAFTNYYKGFLLDPKSEELKKALEVVSPELKFQFGDLDSRSLVDNFLVKLYFEQQANSTITEVLGADVTAFKAAISDFLKDADAQPQNLLSNAVIEPCIEKNEAETFLAISQIILFDHSNAEAAAFFSKKAYDLAPQNYRVLLNYASTILRQKSGDMSTGEQAFELIQKAFEVNPDDVLLTHTYAFLVLKKAQVPSRIYSHEIRSILKDMQRALTNPKTNHMLVADSGLRLWFKLFEDDEIQAQLLKEEEDNQRRAIQPHKAYLNGLLKGAFNKLCLEPFFISCLSEVVLTNPGLEKVLSPFRTAFLFELKNLDDFNTLKDLVFALGLQHFRNNYPIPPQDDERERLKEVTESMETLISNNKAIVNDSLTPEFVHLLSITALYEPLDQTPAAKVLSGFKNLNSLHPSLARLIKKSILDHEAEENLLNSLDRVGKIPQQPYIEHLSERLFSFWDNAGIMAGKVTKTTFAKELKVLFPKDESIKKLNDTKKLKVLVACCGSGVEAFQLANVYDNIEVYAFDPSEIHIAYAVRQNKELGNDAKFYVADLMSVSPQDFGVKGFDLVIANNILHNFPNPAQAFAKLCTFVNPGGFLKASVFSRSAILQIAEVRTFLNGKFRKPFFEEKSEFPRLVRKPSVDQAREARWILSDVDETSPVAEFIMNPMCQFFSEFTDIVFHPTIVGFGFDTISTLLKKNTMDLVGFEFPGISQETVLKYQTEHPDDLQLKTGKYLDQFDAKNKDELCPLTFSPHLSFFAQRPEDS